MKSLSSRDQGQTKIINVADGSDAGDAVNRGQLDTKQAADGELSAIAALASNGLIARTSATTAAARTITGTANLITVTNGDGVAGNPTLTVGNLVVQTSGVQTVSNKRITQRVTTLAAGTAYTPAGDTSDEVIYTAPTGNFTINTPSGTPQNGDRKIFRMLTGTTAYTATWNAIYVAGNGLTLPTSFPASTTVNMVFKYDSTLVKWVMLAIDLPQTFFTPLIKAAQRTVTAATTITDGDGYLRFNSASAVSQALPTTGIPPLLTVVIKNVGAGTITVTNTVDGTANRTVAQYASMPFIWTGTAWEIAF